MKNYIAYAISIVVIILSACLITFLPTSETIKTLFSLPGLAGLFMLLVQGWRDQVAHERALELQQRQQDFDLAVASHMTNVVFDKQVSFSEEYSQKIYQIAKELGQEGPSEKATSYSKDLHDLRISYAPWISRELTQNLMPYEAALREIGTLAMLQKIAPNDPHRPTYINKMYSIASKFLGIKFDDNDKEPENFALSILDQLKDVLGIPELEAIRRRAIQLSANQSEPNKPF